MRNFKKFRKALESDTLAEKLLEAFAVRRQRFKVYSYRYRHKSIANQCETKVSSWYAGKTATADSLEVLFGKLSSYASHVKPDVQELVLLQAGKLLDRKFDILGSGEVELKIIDWHADFVSGYRWKEGKFYKDYRQVSLSDNSDVKIPRELSRCHHFLILGQAYLITGDEKYTREFLRQISDWIDANPLMKSINWACTMDVSIRAINWIWSLSMFIESEFISDSVLKKILASLYEHGFFIYHNPEKSPFNNHNHYISDLAGQIYLGMLFKSMNQPAIWLTKGRNELFREMRTQILPSGPTYEKSINYHRLVLELLSSAILLLKRNDLEVPPDIWYRLEKMYEFVMYYTKPDGLVPNIGDQDEGRAHPFGIQKNIDHRYLLSTAAIMYGRPDFKQASTGFNADSFFLLGDKSRSEFDQIEDHALDLQSRAFADAGFYILRKHDNYMFVNISGKGGYPEYPGATHTHSDLLSFELVVGNKTYLVDPGTHTYSSDPGERMLFRSTAMHNTVTVDGKDQNILLESSLWDFERNAIPTVISWISNSDRDLFEGSHSGYQRLIDPVTHKRRIIFDKKLIKWTISDCIEGKGNHLMEAHFHFDEGIDFDMGENHAITNCADGKNISFRFESQVELKLEKRNSWLSKHYGTKTESKVLVVCFNADCPIELKTIIEPT